jgi:pyruvate dehydrogenase E1 component beta subunit
MTRRSFGDAIDLAVGHAMAADERIVVFGEDVPMLRRRLLVRFGPDRVRATPISESAFLGASVGAALGGLRPIVEIMLVDFVAVALSALMNEAAKIGTFTAGSWTVPMVVRATCGAGYGDAGQHGQALWGLLAGIPGLSVVVPSNPADAAGLMLAAIEEDGPVVYLEHKLLSEQWLEWMGGSRRPTVEFDVPERGSIGEVEDPPRMIPLGEASLVREGGDIAMFSLGVGLHRSTEAADRLSVDGIEATVVDLRTVAPLDRETITEVAAQSRRVLVVDEDYLAFGLSGEVAAVITEAGIPIGFARVATEGTLPYARDRETRALPNVERIISAARTLVAS